ncbi:hypothetical protein VTJ83DRAFT_5756 [Remersonia thermophila]|uniref:Uncharacterized protein n=1 Tax=Remersonia thermophila TaxID=72144 RepID=A0ABR4D8Q3_9PEZI
MRTAAPVLAALLSFAAQSQADPTWPAATDHMEEIVFQVQGFRGSLFTDIITPCDNEAAGPGRNTAAEWLRVGFHDMATHNRYFGGSGGLDGSIQFELKNGENTGPGHKTTLEFLANYLTARSSLADLIAAGVYASVRACGGPVVPLRLGRVDATGPSSGGVPQPQNSVGSFINQFDRLGFSQSEMIQLVACGHTLGSVHHAEFPQIIPTGHTQISFDESKAAFDNKVVTEYLDGTTNNPLVTYGRSSNRHSDFKVFNSDGNATISALADPTVFSNTCQAVLQKMIDVVPPSVTLTDPIVPYTVKPVDMQLTLNAGGTAFRLSGYIRIRTTTIPAASIQNVVLTWKDRNGNSCGSSACSYTATLQGVSTGLDDTFGFFPIDATIPVASGISSFVVTVNRAGGSSDIYDNNGNEYPLHDAVVLQNPQSCLLQGSGALTVSALVRNDLGDVPVTLGVSYLTPRNTTNDNPVPALNEATITMTKGDCVGLYTFYSGSFVIPGGLSYNARLSVTAGSGEAVFTDDFNKASNLAGTCSPFTGGVACGDVPATTVSTSSATGTAEPTSESTSVPASTTSTSATPTPTGPVVKPTVGGYVFVSCWTEGSGVRALSEAAFAYDEMTLESCMNNCTGYTYWATEYGRECFCGNSLHPSSSEAPLADCNMPCAGDPFEYCGAGNRLQLYSTTAAPTATSTATSTPTGVLSHKPTVGAYTFVGCQTEAAAGRALTGKPVLATDDLTLEACEAYCTGFEYFGAEYGRECFCGNSLAAGSVEAPLSDCSMLCAGNPLQYCGAGNRLELYRLSSSSEETSTAVTTAAPSSSTSTEAATTTSAPSTTLTSLIHVPTVSPFTFIGCWTEATGGVRALSDKATASGTEMTIEACAEFCSGYRYFGTEYSAECFCGNTLHASSTNASLEDCSMTCSGNPLQYCGGPSRLNLYENMSEPGSDPQTPPPPPQPSHPANVTAGSATWNFVACRTEATGVRALASEAWAADSMTLESCAGFCQGYKYFGTEYARECFCGNSFGPGSAEVPATDCSMPCAGNGGQLCGAGNRLSVYEREE